MKIRNFGVNILIIKILNQTVSTNRPQSVLGTGLRSGTAACRAE